TVLAERMIDLVVLFALLVLSAIGVAQVMTSEHLLVTEYILAVGLVFVALLIAGLVVLRFLGGSVERRLPLRVRSLFGKFQHGILGSFRARQFPTIATITIVIWATEAGRLYFVTKALGMEIALPVILFAALANSLLTAVPATPGGLGVVEAGVIGFFSLAGVQDTSAASATLLDRAISYWSLIVVGLPLYVLSFRRQR
ncbi:MAG: flippase-like domain-containing protein, partial [Dehalococcoidia bacterium]|nr:flippase-like domain-containing protein [Dehalococcoidia bacterium]